MITLICSNYNSSKWIDGYLKSINDQFLASFAIVIVDANSTDDSLEKIKSFKFREGIQVKLIELKERINVYDAWNIGIKEATTPYVMNYNTDDRLFPSALLTLMVYASVYPDVDIFYQQFFITFDESHQDLQQFARRIKNHNHPTLLNYCYGGPFPLVKKSTIEELGYFNSKYTMSGDYDMWLRMSKAGKKFMRVEEFMGSYYYNPIGLSTNPATRAKQEAEDAEIRALNQ